MPEAPEQLHVRFQEAFNRRDLEGIVALYEPEAALVRDGRLVQGHAALRDAFREVLSRRPSIEVKTIAVHRAGDLAMLHGTWILRENTPGGGHLVREGRNTEAVRLQSDGRWLFVIDNPFEP